MSSIRVPWTPSGLGAVDELALEFQSISSQTMNDSSLSPSQKSALELVLAELQTSIFTSLRQHTTPVAKGTLFKCLF
jgi:hypothetical protein